MVGYASWASCLERRAVCESEVLKRSEVGKVRREEKEQSYVEAKVSQRRRGNGRQGAVEKGGAPIRPRSCVRKDGDRAQAQRSEWASGKRHKQNVEVLGHGGPGHSHHSRRRGAACKRLTQAGGGAARPMKTRTEPWMGFGCIFILFGWERRLPWAPGILDAKFLQPGRHNLEACHPWLQRPKVDEYRGLTWMNVILWNDQALVLVVEVLVAVGHANLVDEYIDGGWTFYTYHPPLVDSFHLWVNDILGAPWNQYVFPPTRMTYFGSMSSNKSRLLWIDIILMDEYLPREMGE